MARELTLDELRAWLEAVPSRTGDAVVDDLFAEQDLALSDIPVFSDLDPDALGGFAPSELVPLVDAIREVNALFFATWRRRLSEARRLMETLPHSSCDPSPA